MFSFIKKWRQQRLRKKITLLYLSNHLLSGDKSYEYATIYINTLCANIEDPKRVLKMFDKENYPS